MHSLKMEVVWYFLSAEVNQGVRFAICNFSGFSKQKWNACFIITKPLNFHNNGVIYVFYSVFWPATFWHVWKLNT